MPGRFLKAPASKRHKSRTAGQAVEPATTSSSGITPPPPAPAQGQIGAASGHSACASASATDVSRGHSLALEPSVSVPSAVHSWPESRLPGTCRAVQCRAAQQQAADPQLEEVSTLWSHSTAPPVAVPAWQTAKCASSPSSAHVCSLQQQSEERSGDPQDVARREESQLRQEQGCLDDAAPQTSSVAQGPPDTGTAEWAHDYEGQDIAEDVLNALPSELKHEVRLAVMSRLKRKHGKPQTDATPEGRSVQACSSPIPVTSQYGRANVALTRQSGTAANVGAKRSTNKPASIRRFFSKQS